MQQALHALTDELRRLKNAGVKTITVSDESVQALRRAVAARGAESAPAPSPTRPSTEVAAAASRPVSAAPTSAPRPSTPVARAVAAPAASASLPPPPTVKLPEGDKAQRWAALLALVTGDPVCRASVRAGKKVVLGV